LSENDLDKACKVVGRELYCKKLVVFGKSRGDCLHQIFFGDLRQIQEVCETKIKGVKGGVLIKTSDPNTYLTISPGGETG
jgi:hypothetical protein